MRHHLSLCHPKYAFDPAHKARLKGLTVDFGKHIPKGVMGRNPMLQLQKLTKPASFAFATVSIPTQLSAPHKPTDRDDENVHQFMVTSPLYSWVG